MFSAVIRLISKSDKDEAQTILKDLQSIEDADCNLKVAKNIVIDYCYKHLELLRYKQDRKNLY
jgi:CRISPR/Cas system-associated endonuclease Cas1